MATAADLEAKLEQAGERKTVKPDEAAALYRQVLGDPRVDADAIKVSVIPGF